MSNVKKKEVTNQFRKDINNTLKLISRKDIVILVTKTAHHPKCDSLIKNDIEECDCGGWQFGVSYTLKDE